MIRYHRMQDLNVNWIPGMDHAGIATQALFDKELQRNGENRYEIGRELYTDMVRFEWGLTNSLWSGVRRTRIVSKSNFNQWEVYSTGKKK